MLTPTVTTKRTTENEFRREAPGKLYTVWPYWVARPRTVSVAAGLALALLTLLYFTWIAYAVSVNHSIQQSVPILVALVGCQLCLYFHRLYDLGAGTNWRDFVAKALQSLAATIGLVLAVFEIFPGFPREDYAALLMLFVSTSLIVALRPVARWMVKHKRLGEQILIVGTGNIGQKLHEEIARTQCNSKTQSSSQARQFSVEFAQSPDMQMLDCHGLTEMIRSAQVSRIVLAEPDPQTRRELGAALLGCKLRGILIQEAVDFYEQFGQKIWLEGIHPEWLIYSDGFRPSKLYISIKRLIDIVASTALISITGPIMGMIALAIKLDSTGPVLFRQERIGLDGKEFVLLKFRSMRQDAESGTGPTWARVNDSRITRLGRILRKFRLDELPQAFNVLSGEMSFVGPRPERPYFVELLRQQIPYYDLRHYVKPGITGWAQVMYPYGASVEDSYEKLQYDFYYAKHISIGMDLVILAKTMKVVLFGRGQ
jgi:sugar transferase (PEP-CTERM system associated)